MDHFPILLLLGRPAAGKSEVIDYLKRVPEDERVRRFHIGNFVEIDDFPFVWQVFEDDDILSKHGKPRLWTDERYYFTDDFVWNFFIEKINLSFDKFEALQNSRQERCTAIVEFSRGGKHGFSEAFSFLSPSILSRAAILYIRVSYEESCRKNRRRFDPAQAHSILYHSLPDEKMDFYYKESDWDRIAPDRNGTLELSEFDVPYAVLQNEPEVTDSDQKLGPALEEALGRLWGQKQGYQASSRGA
jgi:hypothetical protein